MIHRTAAHRPGAFRVVFRGDDELVRGPIVVGYDGSDASRRAVARAGDVARPDGEVVVISVARDGLLRSLDEAGGDPPAAHETAALLDEAEALLRGRDPGLEITTRAETGDAADALIRTALGTGAELIVVGARGRSFVARTLLGSVAEKLVKHAPCDVLVTR